MDHFLLIVVYEDLEDGLARQVYASWVEERAQDDHQRSVAALIRLHLELEALPEGDPAREGFEERETGLLPHALVGWRARLGNIVSVGKFRRGLPEAIVLDTANFIRSGKALLHLLPAWRVRLERAGRHAQALANCPYLREVRDLNLRDAGMTDEAVAALACSPHVGGLRQLDLWGNQTGEAGARALLGSNNLAQGLRLTLDLGQISSSVRQRLRQRFDLQEP